MEGMEVTGVDASVVSLISPFRNIMTLFTSFQIARSSALELEENILAMRVLHLRFSRWGAAVKLSGEVVNLNELHAAVRNRTDVVAAKEVLARIARRFEDIAKIATGRKVGDDVTRATNNESTPCEILIQRMRDLTKSRQCTVKAFSTFRWYLVLEKIRHNSFRRQGKLSAGKANWIFCKEDKSHITQLTKELAELMGDLEWRVPGDDTIMRSCCNEEVSMILFEAPLGSTQLTLLWRDVRLQEAIARRERGAVASNPRVDEDGLI